MDYCRFPPASILMVIHLSIASSEQNDVYSIEDIVAILFQTEIRNKMAKLVLISSYFDPWLILILWLKGWYRALLEGKKGTDPQYKCYERINGEL